VTNHWIPAFAGMTGTYRLRRACPCEDRGMTDIKILVKKKIQWNY